MNLAQTLENPDTVPFGAAAQVAIARERARALAGEISESSAKIFEGRVHNHLLPYFVDTDIKQIGISRINAFVEWLGGRGLKRSSIRLMLTALRRVLHHAYHQELIPAVPQMPRIHTDSTPRGGFNPKEYLALWQTARTLLSEPVSERITSHRDTAGGLFSKDYPLLFSMPNLIRFMVNTFIRPTDLRWMQHKHIQVVRGRHVYLRLELPESKRHTTQIISMRPAVSIYESLLREAKARGRARPDDFVFLPEVANANRPWCCWIFIFGECWRQRVCGMADVARSEPCIPCVTRRSPSGCSMAGALIC